MDPDKVLKMKSFDSNWKKLQETLEKPVKTERIEWQKISRLRKRKWKEERKNPKSKASSSSDPQKPSVSDLKSDAVAMDCEFVGVGSDKKGNMLARVSIVNSQGDTVYDTFVSPTEKVTDFRTNVSGIRPSLLSKGIEFSKAKQEVEKVISSKILVGHAIHNDLKVLGLNHPKSLVRDTSKYAKFREACGGGGKTPSLKKVSRAILGVEIQKDEHDSVSDAKVSMQLYMLYRKVWEKELKKGKPKKKPRPL